MTGAIPVKLFFIFFFTFAHAQDKTPELRFTPNERVIINSVINQFKRECGHIAVLDEAKIKEIQEYYQSKKDSMVEDQRNCYGEFLSQLVGTHNIHRQTCDGVTPKKHYGKDKDLARVFLNVRKHHLGIRTYHEKLNDCLIRKGAPSKEMILFSDFEKNSRTLSKKIREIKLDAPFKENSVNYR